MPYKMNAIISISIGWSLNILKSQKIQWLTGNIWNVFCLFFFE